jgi:hypothetical protein
MAKQYFKAVSILSLLAMVLAFVPAASVHADAPPPLPVVDGLFYLPGEHGSDENNYYFLADSGSRGTLYYRLEDVEDTPTLFVTVVVSNTVNDNVFGQKGTDGAYLASADWSAVHTAGRLINSDHLELALECGDYSYDWFQDYVYDDGAGGWLSDPYGPDGNGTPPPWSMETASSGQWNLNNSAWDYTANRDPNDSNTWLSLNQGDPNTVQDDGWPTSQGDPAVNTVDDPAWEWAMVYEMSIDVSACGNDAITIWPVSAHNSPSKDGDQDIPFEPVDLFDFGDAPASYGTLLADDGARHALVVGGPYLGPSVDAEKDGQPDLEADGDDIHTQNDADGVTFLTSFLPGTLAQIQVTGTAGACLNFWIDFDGNGTFDPDEHFPHILTGGADILTIPVPGDATLGLSYSRFRVSSECPLEPTPTGPAPDGEVEDYVLPLGPTAVELLWFNARPEGRAIALRWETASEVDNAGFNLYRATSLAGEKMHLNADLIPSKVPPGSPIGAEYSWQDTQVVAGTVYFYWLEDVDIYGRATLHGPVKAKAQAPKLVPIAPILIDPEPLQEAPISIEG